MLNAHVTNIRTRNAFLLWLLRFVVRLCGAEMRLWRTRKGKERIVQPTYEEAP
jgi:hypothetical protein